MNFLLSALLLIAPITSETAKFTIYQDGKKVGVEEFTITARTGGYTAQGRTELVADPIPITSTMELDERLNPTSYEYKRGTSAIRIKIDDPVSEYTTVADGRESTIDFRFPAGGFIVDTDFFHHYLLLLYKVGAAGATLPVFVPQDLRMGSVTVRSAGSGKYTIEAEGVKLDATTDGNGRLMRLSVPDAKVVIER